MLAGNETPIIGKALDLGDDAGPATSIAAE